MKYGQIRKFDIANGEGIRTSLFVTGCTHKCPHCFNEEYQDFSAGKDWDKEAEEKLFQYILNPKVAGLTLLGGEPMENTKGLIPLAKKLREKTEKTLWIYSGYTWEEIMENEKMKELLSYAHVLVDGKFINEKKDLRLRFRGSSNQRIIDVQKSLKNKKIIIYME